MNLQNYATLALTIGVNLQKDDELYITAEVEQAEYARALAVKAYEMGAKKVIVTYIDHVLTKAYLTNASIETISVIPEWQKLQKNSVAVNKGCNIFIVSTDPDYLDGVDTQKIIANVRASNEAFKPYKQGAMNNEFRWLVLPAASVAWAKKVFPNMTVRQAVNRLTKLIEKSLLLDKADAVKAWRDKIDVMNKRAQILNDADIVSFHFKNNLGTDFTVAMPKNYYFTAAEEKSVDGIPFTANLPTEEVFSVPDRNRASGTLVASKPLIYNGNLIEGFSLTFKNGRVVSFSAEKGYDTLEALINMDEGSSYLGEIALVQNSSQISQMNTLFFETLYDENASCHFALGNAYPLVKDVAELDEQARKKRGLNYSGVHCDFMVGTADLSIIATTSSGSKLVVFEKGDFVF